ncbi:MAG TPA: hypothetical protein VGJ44_01155 [Kribbellaceae bacterium]
MGRGRLRALTRAAFIACGLSLIAVAVVLALLSGSELPSVAALLAGVLLIVFGAAGELPAEIGLQRISFSGSHDSARDYSEALYDAVREALPELRPPRRGPDWNPSQPTYWIDELNLRIVVTWAPDQSYRIGVSAVDRALDPAVARTRPGAAVLLVTNVDEIDDLQAALNAALGERGSVVRWRSPTDTDQLRRRAHELKTTGGV